MKQIIEVFECKIVEKIKAQLCTETVENIQKAHGNSKNSPACCKKGSFIYFLYDDNGKLLYIGETGVSVKNRMFLDGTGAHNKKSWFKNVKEVRYYQDNNMDFDTRKLIERVLIKHYDTLYNDTTNNEDSNENINTKID